MSGLIIIGAGGHGKVVADIVNKMNLWDEVTFLDDNNSIDNVLGYKVVGNVDMCTRLHTFTRIFYSNR